MTKIDVYSGFLGAGKTTLIRKMIAEAYVGEKVVLIENEFGEIAIDGGFLQDTGVEITEMNSGCICCSLVGDFGEALEQVVADFHPDRIIIEPSGVGKLSDVLGAVRKVTSEDVVLGSAVAVVDCKKCAIYLKNFGEFYANQIANASVILLSRSDDLDKAQTAAVRIRQQNAKATIITTPWDKLTGLQILEVMEKKASLLEELVAETAQKHHSHAADVFTSWGLETSKAFSRTQLEGFCKALLSTKTYGTVLRAKGYVAGEDGVWYQFDYVPGEVEVRMASPNVTGQICVIGSGLKKDAIASLLGV